MKRLISILAGLFCCLLLHCQEEDIVFFTLPDDIIRILREGLTVMKNAARLRRRDVYDALTGEVRG